MKPRVFLDTNILIDLLLQRPGLESSAQILQAGEDGRIELCCSFLTMANLAFILRKTATPARLAPSLMQIQSLVTVLSMDSEQLSDALKMDGKDFEDILQAVCAAKAGCTAIITSNQKDFQINARSSDINIPPVFGPKEFMNRLSVL